MKRVITGVKNVQRGRLGFDVAVCGRFLSPTVLG